MEDDDSNEENKEFEIESLNEFVKVIEQDELSDKDKV